MGSFDSHHQEPCSAGQKTERTSSLTWFLPSPTSSSWHRLLQTAGASNCPSSQLLAPLDSVAELMSSPSFAGLAGRLGTRSRDIIPSYRAALSIYCHLGWKSAKWFLNPTCLRCHCTPNLSRTRNFTHEHCRANCKPTLNSWWSNLREHSKSSRKWVVRVGWSGTTEITDKLEEIFDERLCSDTPIRTQ